MGLCGSSLWCLYRFTSDSGADPRAGKGRGTNKLSCRWLGRVDSLVSCCIL